MTAVAVRIEREPPGGWAAKTRAQGELDRCFGRSALVSWLYADWYADEKGDPCERWVVYQMLPAQYVKPDMLEALKGPAPMYDGYWAQRRESYQTVAPGCHPLTSKRWVSNAHPGLTQRKWELWRETGCEATLFWIVQGGGGGHKYKIKSPTERKLRKLSGLAADTPPIGALLYAPFDDRVIDQLVSLDEERKQIQLAGELLNRSNATADRAEAAELTHLRQQLKKWWEGQVDEAIDLAGMTGRGGWWARHRTDFPRGEALDKEKIEEEFLTVA